MPANPPFQVEGPPYPTDLPLYQSEALSWLRNNPDGELPNRTHAESLEMVKRLYEAGAVNVDVVVKFSQPGYGGAKELEVTFPRQNRKPLLEVIRSLHPDNWEDQADEREDPYEDDESFSGEASPLWWD